MTSIGGDHEERGAILEGGETDEQSGHRVSEKGPGGEAAEMSAPPGACPSTKLPAVREMSYD